MALPDGLLEAVKNKLDITWTDPDTDRKLIPVIEDGMAYLDRIAGASMDYSAAGAPRRLLYNYVLYERANALDDFGRNYLPDLVAMQLEQEATIADDTSDTSTTG